MAKTLKLSFLTLTLVFLGINVSMAQFAFGVKFGGSSANFSNIDLNDYKPKQRLYLNTGFEANYIIARRFAIQVEAVYSGKGSQYQYTGSANYNGQVYSDVTIDAKNRLGYLALPIMGQFLLGDRENHFHLDFGVVPNLLITKSFTATAELPTGSQGAIETKTIDYNFTPGQNDFGVAFGIGLRAMSITFDFRYELGMVDVFIPELNKPAVQNKIFTVSMGYFFPIN